MTLYVNKLIVSLQLLQTRLTSTENTLQPDVAFLRGPITELANYRVLGVIDKVQLVMDKVTETTYVIKVSCDELSSRACCR